ncbi:MAG: hypothetical protein DLM70_14640 [Chloroflexi bacterium]|nr:MAG: hypothetical protein DLM70_14640 [Chloroflexota bacterium]
MDALSDEQVAAVLAAVTAVLAREAEVVPRPWRPSRFSRAGRLESLRFQVDDRALARGWRR